MQDLVHYQTYHCLSCWEIEQVSYQVQFTPASSGGQIITLSSSTASIIEHELQPLCFLPPFDADQSFAFSFMTSGHEPHYGSLVQPFRIKVSICIHMVKILYALFYYHKNCSDDSKIQVGLLLTSAILNAGWTGTRFKTDWSIICPAMFQAAKWYFW